MSLEELTTDEARQAATVREMLSASGDFRPFAVFDEPLDCIRMVMRDCSVTEIRINELLTVLEANYPKVDGASEIVGFTIKGVAHICETNNIPATATWKLAAFLDAVVKESAPRERVFANNVIKPIARSVENVERIAA